MRNFPVHIDLTLTQQSQEANDDAALALMDALAAIDENDDELLDWTVGFDASTGQTEIDMTIKAPDRAKATTKGHAIVQEVQPKC